MRYGNLPKTLPAAHLEIERLRHACAQAYQVMGAALIGDTRFWADEDAIRALGNIAAAANGEICPHEDLLPWSRNMQQ